MLDLWLLLCCFVIRSSNKAPSGKLPVFFGKHSNVGSHKMSAPSFTKSHLRGSILYFFLFIAYGSIAPFLPLIWRSKGLSGERNEASNQQTLCFRWRIGGIISASAPLQCLYISRMFWHYWGFIPTKSDTLERQDRPERAAVANARPLSHAKGKLRAKNEKYFLTRKYMGGEGPTPSTIQGSPTVSGKEIIGPWVNLFM